MKIKRIVGILLCCNFIPGAIYGYLDNVCMTDEERKHAEQLLSRLENKLKE